MFHIQKLLVTLFLFCPLLTGAQILDYIDIRLSIKEKVGNETQPLPNAKLNITDLGEVATDDSGQKIFTYPVRENIDPEISISLLSQEHKTLKPLDSKIKLDTSREELFIEFLVVNLENESEEFKRRIADLENRVAGLRAKNQLTAQQLSALHNQLVDTIVYFEEIRSQMEREISNYEELTEEQRQEISNQDARITDLEAQVDDLTQKLVVALEEKYLRQKQYFDDITSGLRSYVRKAKDLRNHLPFIQSYFSSPKGLENYGNDIKAYNAIYEELDNKRAGLIEGVENYWNSKRMAKRVEDVFDFALKNIHLDQMRPALTEIYDEFLKQRPKKAQKIADVSYENMNVNLRSLEQRINRMESRLRNEL